MTVEEIKELIHVVNESGIAELEVQRGDNRVRIRRNVAPQTQEIVLAAAAPAALPGPAMATIPQSPTAVTSMSPAPAAPIPASELVLVKSPIVGTYYDAASPGSPPFVKVGDRVSPGQVLCIIESMKLMNEIEAEVAGTIVTKLVENGRPVEYGEALFSVQPA